MQLEALIASQKNPKKNIKHKNTYNILISAIILALFVIIVFGILFLLSSNSSSGTNNPPISAEIEIGLTNFPPLFTVQGVIMSITSNQHQQFHDTSIENLNSLVLANDDSLFVVGFPTVSSESWIPDDDILPSITETLTSPNEVTPYVKFSLFFTEPTSISSVQNVEYQNIIQPLTEQQKMDLNDLLNGGSRAELFPIPLPLALLIPTSESIRGIDNFTREMRLELLDDTWTITGETNNIPVEFLRTEGYTMVIWSQPVSGNLLGSSSSSSLTTLIIYLIIVIVVGLGIRRIILGKMSTLWIDNMEEPQNLYRMIVAINAYRSAGEMAKESELTENLLDILRSHEKCVAMTSKK